MKLEEKLKEININISNEDLEMARDQLNSLIANYPNEMRLRRKIAEVYLQLKQPIMAGRYLFLEEELNDTEKDAVNKFVTKTANNPIQILREIKFKGDIDNLPGSSKNKLIELQEIAKKRYKFYPDFQSKNNNWKNVNSLDKKLVKWGCLSIMTLFAILSLIGIYSLIIYIFELII